MSFLWILVLPAIFILDWVLLWCERRGWLYYRKRKANGGNTAIMSMTEFLNPGVEQTSQYLEQERITRVKVKSEGDSHAERGNLPVSGMNYESNR